MPDDLPPPTPEDNKDTRLMNIYYIMSLDDVDEITTSKMKLITIEEVIKNDPELKKSTHTGMVKKQILLYHILVRYHLDYKVREGAMVFMELRAGSKFSGANK